MRITTIAFVSTIIVLLALFMFFSTEGKLKDLYDHATAKQTCKASVETHAKLKLRYADFSSDVKCPTVKLKINDKNEEAAKKKIADLMRDCWDNFGRGKLELFTDDNVYCAVCYRVDFGKDVKINDFSKFLASKSDSSKSVSYLKYLTTEKTDDTGFIEEFNNKKISDAIDGSKDDKYAVVFTYIKGKKYLDEYLKKARNAAPGAGSVIVGVMLIAQHPVIGTILVAGGAIWAGLETYFTKDPFQHIALINFIPYNPEQLTALNCKDLPVLQQ
ncbi:MAG TPA: hypothetical protein VI564_07410 [Candidatus Nanoarchaeia archaeon]|nr:hypothetical protein [Candidatus Nanoarchaeia archaeon]